MKKNLIYGLIGLGISGGIGYFLGKKGKEKLLKKQNENESTAKKEDDYIEVVEAEVVANWCPKTKRFEKVNKRDNFKPQNTLTSIKLALSMGKRIQTKSGEPVQKIRFYEFLNKVSVDTTSVGSHIEFTPKEFWEVFEAVD